MLEFSRPPLQEWGHNVLWHVQPEHRSSLVDDGERVNADQVAGVSSYISLRALDFHACINKA